MEAPAKGTVTPVASLFPAEEAQKAVKRVEDKVAELQKEMNRLNQFIADNANLVSLVKKLPDKLHHDIIVPFGKAAFFPGRLMHTNEFLVFLGENHYVERTSKQTVDILRRTGKSLKSQVHSLRAMMQDLEAEASFFSATASEAAEGLVEIREDCLEETFSERAFESGIQKQGSSTVTGGVNVKAEVEDAEFAHMMSRLDELEMEEREHEGDSESDEDNESDVEEDESSSDVDIKEIQSLRSSEQPRDKGTATEVCTDKDLYRQDFNDKLNCTGMTARHFPKEEASRTSVLPKNIETSNSIQIASKVPEVGGRHSEQLPAQKSKPELDSSKAFTGSIVERNFDMQPKIEGKTASPSQSSGSQPSKPVSRFKMQRR